MPLARKVSEHCPRCGDDQDVWLFEKEELTIIKEHYTCEACGCEWSDRRAKN
jgi:uncharacterized protein (DUF983 family)